MRKQYHMQDDETPLHEHPALNLIHWQAKSFDGRVSTRALYKRLGVHKEFNSWLADYVESMGMSLGRDYVRVMSSSEEGSSQYDYLVTEFTALEIVMNGRGALAKFVRRSVLRRDGLVRIVSDNGVIVNLRDAKAIPAPENDTSKPNLSAKIIDIVD